MSQWETSTGRTMSEIAKETKRNMLLVPEQQPKLVALLAQLQEIEKQYTLALQRVEQAHDRAREPVLDAILEGFSWSGNVKVLDAAICKALWTGEHAARRDLLAEAKTAERAAKKKAVAS